MYFITLKIYRFKRENYHNIITKQKIYKTTTYLNLNKNKLLLNRYNLSDKNILL